ncbi:F-box/LRR-repeat protein At4g14096-like [Lotus japonicus]|uniref:F-box/LRR-repeat protein At4g14096-like n=1 Tax=Lotus japonicus TaxID=34305 RepID=UPI002583DBBA|nr:F-box/LRR-repeat protein At4g14096-like [Lotus japonicus]
MSSLKTLTVYYDLFGPDAMLTCTIKIDAVNLVTFSITSYLTVQFVLVNLDSLVDAHVDFVSFDPFLQQIAGPCTINLLRGFGNMKTLRLSNDTVECLSYAKTTLHLLPMFNNLTYLDVDLGATESTHEALMDILQKMPKLETLYIPTGFHPDVCMNGKGWILNSVPCCFKSCLKLFCISDFDGGVAEMELLKFVLKNATVLGEIQLFYTDAHLIVKLEVWLNLLASETTENLNSHSA